MARVEWTRTGADDVEHVLAMSLCLEHPNAVRVRPARGDGGIDVLAPLDSGGYAVYQVKSFAANLGSSQLAQIKNSYESLLAYAATEGLDVHAWHVAMPLDPTNNNRDWLAKLGEGAPFSVHWFGLANVEGLISKYPEVVDYYLHDGRGRLESALSSLTDLVRTGWGQAPGRPQETRLPVHSSRMTSRKASGACTRH